MPDTPVPVPAGATFGPAIQDQSQAVPVPTGATFGPAIGGGQTEEMTQPGTGAFNAGVQKATNAFTSDLGIPKDWSVGNLIQSAKQKWADMQAARDEEGRMNEETMKHIKQGNYGQAAELLLGHIAKQGLGHVAEQGLGPLPGIAKGVADIGGNIVSGGKALAKGEVGEGAGHLAAAGAKVLPLAMGGEAAEGLEGGEAAASAGEKAPGIFKQIFKGKEVAQRPARAALEAGAKASSADAGIATSEGAGKGVRTLLDEPITAAHKAERASYEVVNKAAETDMKDLFDRREELQDALDDPTNVANRRALSKELSTTEKAIKVHTDQAATKGVDAAQAIKDAESKTQQRYAMENLKQKLFNNESVVKGNVAHGAEESIDVDAAIKEVEKLDKPSKFAREGSPSRLKQALGDKGAGELKQALYDAQKAGEKALARRKIAEIFAGSAVGVSTIGGAIYKAVH